jgi:predicted transcriptional regulator
MDENTANLANLTSIIVTAYVGANPISPANLPSLIADVHKALSTVGQPEPTASAAPIKLTPSQIRKSITPDALISFEDGRAYKTLKRHLTVRGMTMADYKSKWGLPTDYPTTAPSYSARRSQLARAIGLGQLRQQPAPVVEAPVEAKVDTTAARRAKSKKVAELV